VPVCFFGVFGHRKERRHFNRKDYKAIKDHWDKTKRKGWGQKAVIEWLFHLALDNLQTAYKRVVARGEGLLY